MYLDLKALAELVIIGGIIIFAIVQGIRVTSRKEDKSTNPKTTTPSKFTNDTQRKHTKVTTITEEEKWNY